MPKFSLPDPFVGGPVADADHTETFKERFNGTQRNFDGIKVFLNELGQRFFWGEGDPENVVTADVGCVYFRLDGGANTTLYVKEANSDDTGWQAK